MTDEVFTLVKSGIAAGRFSSLSKYFEALVRGEAKLLSRDPCEDCKVAESFRMLIQAVQKKRLPRRKR